MASWWSILPESIIFIETWAIRIFVVLGLIVIFPWVLLIIYDVLLFAFRVITYDIPYIGGRARNRPRPRAPSLSERANGRSRRLSLTLPGVHSSTNATAKDDLADVAHGLKQRFVGDGENGNGHKRAENYPVIED